MHRITTATWLQAAGALFGAAVETTKAAGEVAAGAAKAAGAAAAGAAAVAGAAAAEVAETTWEAGRFWWGGGWLGGR